MLWKLQANQYLKNGWFVALQVFLMSRSTIVQSHRRGQFYWLRKLAYLEKIYHKMLCRVHLVTSGNNSHILSGDKN
jgi:hypothetical protein